LEEKIQALEQQIKKAVENQDYFTAADLKEEVSQLKQEIYQLKSANDVPKDQRPTLTAEDIEKVIAEKYGISSKVLSKSELEFLSELENTLNKEII
jgi:ATP-dependent Clp protease ATP-binding subunit ClpA